MAAMPQKRLPPSFSMVQLMVAENDDAIVVVGGDIDRHIAVGGACSHHDVDRDVVVRGDLLREILSLQAQGSERREERCDTDG